MGESAKAIDAQRPGRDRLTPRRAMIDAATLRLTVVMIYRVFAPHREVLDRMPIFSRRHLEKVLAEYIDHYNHARPHQGSCSADPVSRPT